jgi:hypothetical protein
MGLTPMEQQLLDARRAGKDVAVDSKVLPGGKKVVSLREIMQPSELPIPPALQVAGQVFDRPAEPQPDVAPSNVIDPEKLKDMLFGQEPVSQPAEPTQQPEPDLLTEPIYHEPVQAICKRCGWDQRKELALEPTEADKLAFLESVLGGGRFVRDVPLMGGKLVVRFQTLLVEEEDAIMRYLRGQLEAGKVMNNDEWGLAYLRARLLGSIAQVISADRVKPYGGLVVQDEIGKQIEGLFAKLPMPVHGILYQALSTFDELVRALTSRANDQNFWRGPAAE